MKYECLACEYRFESTDEKPYCPCCDNTTFIEIEDTFIEPIKKYKESHHIWPRFMSNKNGKGKQFVISKKRHSILHGKIINWIWEEIPEGKKKDIIKVIIKKSKEFLK